MTKVILGNKVQKEKLDYKVLRVIQVLKDLLVLMDTHLLRE